MYNAQGRLQRERDRSKDIEAHLPLIRKIAGQLKARLPANVEMDDLIQTGMIGLMDALERYEENADAQFETYAGQRVKGAMLDYLRDADWLPRSLRKQMRQVETAIHRLTGKLGRPPTESEIAQSMGLSLEDYQGLLASGAGHQLVYYEDFQGDDDGDHFLERFCGPDIDDPLQALIQSGFRGAVIEAIERLPERERIVMGLYYEQELNLKEIGAVLGVTESRVSQIHSQCIARMRNTLRAMQWSDLGEGRSR